MSERIWDKFLTPQDKAHVAQTTRKHAGFGERAALLLIDNYRGVVGDEPEPLMESIKKWPSSTGLAGWEALKRIEVLVAEARAAELPVVHITGLSEEESGVAGWSAFRRSRAQFAERTPEEQDRHDRRHDIVEQAAPIEGEAVLRKTAPSSFHGTPLLAHLHALKVDTIIVAGESTSGCVRASVVDGAAYRYRMVVVEDCVYDRHEATHAINLFDMSRKYADVLSLDAVVDWLHGVPSR